MTITITLDAQTELAIARKAARMHISPAEYVERLAKRSARQKVNRLDMLDDTPEQRLRAIIDRADPVELKAHGITLAKYPANSGAELVENLLSAGLLSGYGGPDVDSPELACQLREQAQTRDWS